MNDEIKEILKNIKKVANRETASRNALMEMKDTDYQLLLDYITNLQQRIEKAVEYIEKNDYHYMNEYALKRFRNDLLNILNGKER